MNKPPLLIWNAETGMQGGVAGGGIYNMMSWSRLCALLNVEECRKGEFVEQIEVVDSGLHIKIGTRT